MLYLLSHKLRTTTFVQNSLSLAARAGGKKGAQQQGKRQVFKQETKNSRDYIERIRKDV